MDKASIYAALIVCASVVLLLVWKIRLGIRSRIHIGARDQKLEAEFRSAILSPEARESLLQDALRKTNGDRVAAMRRVLEELHGDNERW